MGVETVALVITAAAAAASTGVAVANYEASQSAARAEKDLRDQQAAQLQREQQAAEQQAEQQAVAGQSFGFTDESHRTMLTGFGFGTAPSGSPNSGRQQITGMG